MSDEILITKTGYIKLCELDGVNPHPSMLAYFDGLIDLEQVQREVDEDRAKGRYVDRGALPKRGQEP